MKFNIYKPVQVEAKFIRCNVAVRYDDEDMPNDFPFRTRNMWDVTIDIDTGKIIDWPEGVAANIHMKVCDQGNYYLIATDGSTLAKLEEEYVPCCVPGSYGDYIEFDIGVDGTIDRWKKFCDVRNVLDAFGLARE